VGKDIITFTNLSTPNGNKIEKVTETNLFFPGTEKVIDIATPIKRESRINRQSIRETQNTPVALKRT
jgi:hypothetical protein